MLPGGFEFCAKVPQVLLTSVGAHAPQKSSGIGRPHQSGARSAPAEGGQPVTGNEAGAANADAAELMHVLHCLGWGFLEVGGVQFLPWAQHP